MHYFLEKLIILVMKTEKHPVAMKICIAQDFSVFIINIWVYVLFLRKAYHVDYIKMEKHPVAMQICIVI